MPGAVLGEQLPLDPDMLVLIYDRLGEMQNQGWAALSVILAAVLAYFTLRWFWGLMP